MSSFLSRDAFRNPPLERRKKIVEIPEMGGSVIVQSMTARERGAYELQFIDKAGNHNPRMAAKSRELMTIASCVDEQGNKLFTPEDVEMLSGWDQIVLDRIYLAANELREVKTVDTHEGN